MMLTAIPCLGVPPVLRAQLATVGANMPQLQLEQLQAQVDADFLTSPPPPAPERGASPPGPHPTDPEQLTPKRKNRRRLLDCEIRQPFPVRLTSQTINRQ